MQEMNEFQLNIFIENSVSSDIFILSQVQGFLNSGNKSCRSNSLQCTGRTAVLLQHVNITKDTPKAHLRKLLYTSSLIFIIGRNFTNWLDILLNNRGNLNFILLQLQMISG